MAACVTSASRIKLQEGGLLMETTVFARLADTGLQMMCLGVVLPHLPVGKKFVHLCLVRPA